MRTNIEERLVTTNHIRLHIVQAGPEAGKPIILLHGFPETWRSWQNQLAPLAEAGFRVTAPDQRGYNLSDKPEGLSAYRLNCMVEDVLGLLPVLEKESVSLVGHDWGGVVAWLAASLYPARVERLVVLNAPYPSVMLRSIFRDPVQLLRSSYVLFFQLPVLPEAMLRNNNWELLVKVMQTSSKPGTFRAEDMERYRQAWWKKGAMRGMLNWYRAFLRRPAAIPAMSRVSVPTQILWGVRDMALGPELAEASLRLCDQGRLTFYEDATHWLQHEEPERVSAALLEFLQ